MIDHASVCVSNLEKSKELYKKMFAPLGIQLKADLPEYKAAGFGKGDDGDFWIGEKTPAGGVHVAVRASSKEEVDEFYKAAIAAGATDNGAPGYREMYAKNYYGAFVCDYDGNNIEAVWRDPSKPSA